LDPKLKTVGDLLNHCPTRADSISKLELLLDAGEPVPEASGQNHSSSSKYSQILRSRAVHVITAFIVLYVGVEVTIGGKQGLQPYLEHCQNDFTGWMVTFMLLRRGGGAASGYVSTAFFGGTFLSDTDRK